MKAGAILLVVVAVLAASVGLLWAFQRHLIYLPSPGPVPPAASVLPGAEDVSFQTADGLRLRGWFVPPVGGARPPGPAVLVCNGNGGDRSMRAALAVALSRLGLAVLLFDYRGYGGNPGSPTEAGLAADARAALGYLAGRPEVDPERVVYFGESLGAAVALRLATERPPAALVLRSPFASLAEVGQRHYPVLPVSLLLRDRYDSAALASRLTAPLLVLAGERDRIVPASHSRRLFAAAPQPKRLVVLEGADHNDLDLLAGPRLVEELRSFLAGVPGLLG
ncbi:MAG TPA: alpha/beta hydrolase [Actinomycetes bacterium]|nr:alpha/beta hydrolase [Actinomycetes bacterium]